MKTQVAILLAALVAGCAGTLEDPERFTGGDGGRALEACPDVPTQILAPTCASSGCHAASAPAADLDLASPDPRARLAGKRDSHAAGLLLDPVNPSASTLYRKLSAPPPFGARMPLGGAALDDRALACVLAWIVVGSSADAGSE